MRAFISLLALASAASFVAAAPEHGRRQLDPFDPDSVSSFVDSITGEASGGIVIGNGDGQTVAVSVGTDGVVVDGSTFTAGTSPVGIGLHGTSVIGIPTSITTSPSSGPITSAPSSNGATTSPAPTSSSGSAPASSPAAQSGGAAAHSASPAQIICIVAFAALGAWGIV